MAALSLTNISSYHLIGSYISGLFMVTGLRVNGPLIRQIELLTAKYRITLHHLELGFSTPRHLSVLNPSYCCRCQDLAAPVTSLESTWNLLP